MVAQCGFSKELGQVAWQQSGGPAFLGQEVGQAPECSGETQNQIDEQVKALVDRAYRYSPRQRKPSLKVNLAVNLAVK